MNLAVISLFLSLWSFDITAEMGSILECLSLNTEQLGFTWSTTFLSLYLVGSTFHSPWSPMSRLQESWSPYTYLKSARRMSCFNQWFLYKTVLSQSSFIQYLSCPKLKCPTAWIYQSFSYIISPTPNTLCKEIQNNCKHQPTPQVRKQTNKVRRRKKQKQLS